MAQRTHQPQQVGTYERPTVGAPGTVLGVLALLLVLMARAMSIF